ncbi:MAG: hypothetical protein HY742_05845 [Deltaproteobacteria bacterium]|nr:hypothetical protein [Deltaproteobacteria bacterium]
MDRMIKHMAVIGVLVVLSGLIMGGRAALGADASEEFFRGKTVDWIVALEAGSTTDLIARTIAPFLAKELNVKIKIENRKTDEGINYLYNQGTKDGLTLGIKDSDSIIGNDIAKAPGVQYETEKLNFIADVYPSTKIFLISPKLPYKTLDALKKAKGLRAGGTSAKGSLAVTCAVMIEVLGLDAKIITGFKGSKELTLATARGEVDFMIPRDTTAMRNEKDGYAVSLLALGNKRSAVLPNVPTVPELGIKVSKEVATAYKFVTSGGLTVVLPPGVPEARVEHLRKVFQRLNNNLELQKAMAKMTGVWLPFVPGQDVQQEMAAIKADKALATKLDALFKKYSVVR